MRRAGAAEIAVGRASDERVTSATNRDCVETTGVSEMPHLLHPVSPAFALPKCCLVDGIRGGLGVKVVGNFQLIPWHAGRFTFSGVLNYNMLSTKPRSWPDTETAQSTRTLELENPADMRVTTHCQLEQFELTSSLLPKRPSHSVSAL